MSKDASKQRLVTRLLLPVVLFIWLGLAWAARQHAETDAFGWQAAEWFAHRGKWIIFALAGLGFTASVVWRERTTLTKRLAIQVCLVCAFILGLTLWRTVPIHFFLQEQCRWDEQGHLRQTAEYTCAPVSLGNLLLARGKQLGVTERELTLLAGTTIEGTALNNLIWAAECFGLRVVTCGVMSLSELERQGGPALVTVSTLPTVRHMTLLTGFSDKGVHFVDPAYGARTISRERFQKIWYGKTLVFAK